VRTLWCAFAHTFFDLHSSRDTKLVPSNRYFLVFFREYLRVGVFLIDASALDQVIEPVQSPVDFRDVNVLDEVRILEFERLNGFLDVAPAENGFQKDE
jgi:hypothetical protein